MLSIEPDAKRYIAADPSTEQVVPFGIDRVQAPQVWDEGFEGEGVTVCIIDTGLYPLHEDIDENYVLGGVSQDPASDWNADGY
ncbi:MAG: hypothetical protein GWN58_29055, partial [Anaerolineae bacterium]|nr:hypothetical protein [Anaerolineae bacterium]